MGHRGDRSLDWHKSARLYLDRLAHAEYLQQKARAKGRKSFRYAPSEYVRYLISCLDRNDENAFKARKMMEGYASAAGV